MGVAGLPVVPAVTCTPAVAVLGPVGDAACRTLSRAVAAPASVASAALSGLAGFGVGSVLDAVGAWVADGTVWLLRQIGGVLGQSTRIDLGGTWFVAHYATMAALAGVVIVPLLLVGVIQAVHQQDAGRLLRSVLVNVPVALLLTGAAVKLVQLGLALTDALCTTVSGTTSSDTGAFLRPVIDVLERASAVGGPGVPAFVLLVGALFVGFGAFLLWMELLVRAAAVYVAVLFLPMALASLAWPAVSHWCRRLVDTLVALVLSKFVIVAVLSLAAGELAGTGSGGFTTVIGGAALLLLAAGAPWALFRLLPFVEAGAVSHLEGAGRRSAANVAAPARSLAQSALSAASVAATGGAPVGVGATGAAGAGGSAGVGPLAAVGAGASPGVGGPAGHVPGSSIPMHPRVAAAGEAYDRVLRGAAASAASGAPKEDLSPDPATVNDDEGSGTVRPPPVLLPRATGTTVRHALDHDRLGPRLITVDPPAGDPGHDGRVDGDD